MKELKIDKITIAKDRASKNDTCKRKRKQK